MDLHISSFIVCFTVNGSILPNKNSEVYESEPETSNLGGKLIRKAFNELIDQGQGQGSFSQ